MANNNVDLRYTSKTFNERVEKIYNQLDSDSNGLLTSDELEKGLQALRLPSSKQDVKDLVKTIGSNETSPGVTLEDFKKFALLREKELQTIFREMDKDGSGAIEVAEVQETFNLMGMKYNEDEVRRLMKRMDKDGNSVIDYDEWLELLLLVPSANKEALFRYWADASALILDDGILVPPERYHTAKGTALSMLAGAIAGVTSRTLTAPLERIKVIYQVQHHTPPPIGKLVASIYKEGGLKAFFRGNGASLMKVAPEMGVKMMTFDRIKRVFAEHDADILPWQRFVAGGLAGAICHSTFFPLEVIKLRLAVTPPGTYSGISDVVKKIYTTEGKFFPFYRGLVACLMSTIPHNGINLAVYETLKQELIRTKIMGDEPGVLGLLGCSASAGIVGQLTCYPFHVVMARMATQGAPNMPKLYNGTWDAFRKTAKMEGVKGFYRGMGVTFLKSIPSQAITLVMYEYMKKYFGIEKKHH